MVCSRRSLGQSAGSERRGFAERKTSSGSKLLDFFRPPATTNLDLEDVVTDFETVGKLRAKLAEAEFKAMSRLSEWARTGENVAIEDVCAKMKELAVIHGDELIQLAKKETRCAEELRKMNNYQCQIAATRRKVADLQERERKMVNHLNKQQTKPSSKQQSLRQDLTKTMDLIKRRELEEDRLQELLKEAEVAKMMFFRSAMKNHGDAHCAYSQKAANIFACQREITEFVPAVAREDVLLMRYEGKPITRQKVDSVRRSIDAVTAQPLTPTSALLGSPKHRRRSEPLRMGTRFEPRSIERVQRSPPPPYSPGGAAVSAGFK